MNLYINILININYKTMCKIHALKFSIGFYLLLKGQLWPQKLLIKQMTSIYFQDLESTNNHSISKILFNYLFYMLQDWSVCIKFRVPFIMHFFTSSWQTHALTSNKSPSLSVRTYTNNTIPNSSECDNSSSMFASSK
jgi:hypothetical protein